MEIIFTGVKIFKSFAFLKVQLLYAGLDLWTCHL